MNLILIGFKSAGKTTFGMELSKFLKMNFIDIDNIIIEIFQKKYGESLTVRQVYIKLGDIAFRILEKEAVSFLTSIKNSVIATGGGTVCDQDNIRILSKIGKFIYLNVKKDAIKTRIVKDAWLRFLDDKHPAKNFEKAFADRHNIYQEVADLIINVDNKTVKEMIQIIKGLFNGK